MNKVYKYGPDTPQFDCFVSGRIVSVGMQNGQIYVWAEQTPSSYYTNVKFVPIGVEYYGEYIGTVFEAHAFEGV
jgi:hypothetical protein